MKLNNHGWGLKEMLIITLILFIFLLVASYNIYILYTKLNVSSASDYLSLELKLETAATRYVVDYNIKADKDTVVSVSQLKKYKYIYDFQDELGNDCNGYIIVSPEKEYSTYISCPEYTTEGYNNSYAK